MSLFFLQSHTLHHLTYLERFNFGLQFFKKHSPPVTKVMTKIVTAIGLFLVSKKVILKPEVSSALLITFFSSHHKIWSVKKGQCPHVDLWSTPLGVTCATLPKDHYVQVPYVSGYSDHFSKHNQNALLCTQMHSKYETKNQSLSEQQSY